MSGRDRDSRGWQSGTCGSRGGSRGPGRHWHPTAATGGSSTVRQLLRGCRHGAGRRIPTPDKTLKHDQRGSPMTARVLLLSLLLTTPMAAQPDDLIRLLQQRNCPDCRLADVDLVHADLKHADLSGTQLQRANLSQVLLDGANLRNTDLRFTNLQGASLRGADLRGSKLYGTDFRQSDLSGACLIQSPWNRVTGKVRRESPGHPQPPRCTTPGWMPQKRGAGLGRKICSVRRLPRSRKSH